MYNRETKIFTLVLLSVAISLALNNDNSNVLAQVSSQSSLTQSSTSSSQSSNIIPPQSVQPNLFFVNAHVDTNPVPNKPFTVYVDIRNPNPSDLIAQIAVPSNMSVLTPIVASPQFTTSSSYQRATWTIMAHTPGTYPVVISAHSNFPFDTETMTLSVNVGSPNSVIVTAINIPGSLAPNDNFTASFTLKNTSNLKDEITLATIGVPNGLELLTDNPAPSVYLDPNQEKSFSWRVRAEAAGSYKLTFSYTSINSGSASSTASVNVGNTAGATGALLSISADPLLLVQNGITHTTFSVKNNYKYPIHNLQILSSSSGAYTSVDTPAWVGDLDVNAIKKIPLGIYTSNQTLSLSFPVSVKYDTNGINYNETYLTELPLQNHPNFKINTIVSSPPLSFAGDVADRIDVQIFNLGLGTDDVYTTLNLPHGISPAWGNATSWYFGRIDTFQTVTASFYVNIDNNAVSGNYPLSLLITTGGQKTSLNVNFVVQKKAIFQLVSVDSSQLYPGATNVPLKVTLQNMGTAPAETLTTTLLSGNTSPGVKNQYITDVGNQENIGNVLSDQIFTTTFFVDLDSYAPSGDQTASVEINWVQNSTYNSSPTNKFVQTITVPYHVASGPDYELYYNGIPWTDVIIVAVVIALVIIFIKKRKKRLKLMKLASLQAGDAVHTESLDMLKLQGNEDLSAVKEKKPDP